MADCLSANGWYLGANQTAPTHTVQSIASEPFIVKMQQDLPTHTDGYVVNAIQGVVALPLASNAQMLGIPLSSLWRMALKGAITNLTLTDSTGAALPIITADIQLSGTAGISTTLVVPVTAGMIWLNTAAAPYSLTANGIDVYRIGTIEWDHYMGANNQSLVIRSKAIIAQRAAETVTTPAPVSLTPQGGTVIAELAGAWDIMPQDTLQAGGTFSTLVSSAHLHIERDNPRSWIYG